MSSRSQMETNSVATRRKNSSWGAFWNDAMWGLSSWEGRNYKHAIISYFKQKTDYIRKLPPLGRANCCFNDLRGIMKLKIGKLGRSEWVNVDWRTGNAAELESCSVAQVSLKPGSSEFWDCRDALLYLDGVSSPYPSHSFFQNIVPVNRDFSFFIEYICLFSTAYSW